MKFHSIKFCASYDTHHNLPKCFNNEVVLLGKSNTGKSTILNVISNNNKLSYTSKKAGNTKLINFFTIKKGINIVDYPGYGYSKTSKNLKQNLIKDIIEYINIRPQLLGLIILIDIRRSLKNFENLIIHIATNKKMSVLILLTKADKVSDLNKFKILQKYLILFKYFINLRIEIFSSVKNIGVKKLKNYLNLLNKKK